MRRIASIAAALAGVIALGISLYLLIGQPSIGKDWLTGWVDDMGTGTPFAFPAAATVLGLLGIVFSAAVFLGAWLMTRHVVVGGVLILLLDMVALLMIAISPAPRTGVFIWAVPGLLMALSGFVLGMHQEKAQEPDGVAEF
jgi:hypothetical protein